MERVWTIAWPRQLMWRTIARLRVKNIGDSVDQSGGSKSRDCRRRILDGHVWIAQNRPAIQVGLALAIQTFAEFEVYVRALNGLYINLTGSAGHVTRLDGEVENFARHVDVLHPGRG